jgi:hypothetical protein
VVVPCIQLVHSLWPVRMCLFVASRGTAKYNCPIISSSSWLQMEGVPRHLEYVTETGQYIDQCLLTQLRIKPVWTTAFRKGLPHPESFFKGLEKAQEANNTYKYYTPWQGSCVKPRDICPQGRARNPPDLFLWNFVFGLEGGEGIIFTKAFWCIPVLVKIGLK